MRVNNYNMWRTSDYILTLLTDASKARVLTLVGKNLEGMVVTADTNADKAKLFKGKFFPIALSRVQVNKTEQEDDYPEPEFDFEPISNTRIQNVISKLEPYRQHQLHQYQQQPGVSGEESRELYALEWRSPQLEQQDKLHIWA
jgi:hypothetical protein